MIYVCDTVGRGGQALLSDAGENVYSMSVGCPLFASITGWDWGEMWEALTLGTKFETSDMVVHI